MSNINKKLRDTELFMLAQFIDVMEVLDKHEKIEDVKKDIKKRRKIYLDYIKKTSDSKNFLSLTLYNENIDTKIENCKEIYSTSVEYKETLKKLEAKYKNLAKRLDQNNKNELEEIKGLIYELCDFDVHLAYKIGLVEGLKIKNKSTE
ncbi:MAG: DUF6809 family protein [Clostridia bacterium]